MTQPFKSIAIIGKYMNQFALQQMQTDLADLARHLRAKNVEVWIEENTAKYAELSGFKTAALAKIGSKVDLAIVMGGDGTMLSVARNLIDYNIPLVGINRGRFGFLTDLRAEDMLRSLDRILSNRYQIESRMLLNAKILRGGKTIYQGLAFNDIVIKGGLRLIEIAVEINGSFVHKQRADGLILSTPTGTTAYALSAGGPILHPSLEAIAIVPVSPHTLSNRPIAVNSSSLIQITLIQSDDGQVSYDGQFQMLLESGDRILIQRAEKEVKLLHPSEYCYFDMLRNKLNWG
ncbi:MULTISPECIES: NAD(+) kinase [Methylotenera]|uniref:NAD(+) kinase n=1 Tax=Methylotenera TaxID=359407 RepID=UPI00036521D8|nr:MULTISPECIES: NAD(+) kinase [Methylotenera]